ncbi:TetR/AcrR family transcriptional regulator [Nocardia sp. NPDC050175]|uniref:TetR/AcrR family transcriptional regulator n=1 Tax=Nocardia sp. NPDC050175 TaxID=3364317 RepID=UPI00379AB384
MSNNSAPNPSRPRKLRADAEANLDRIIDVAEAVFAEHGLDASIDLVAKRAGVGLGTIYRRFANKDALVAELIDRLLAETIAIAERHLHDTHGDGLTRYLYEVCELLSTKRGALARLWSDAANGPMITRSREVQQQLVANAHRHGAIRADLTGEDVAVALWSIHGILDVTRGSTVNAWRRQLDLLLLGFADNTAIPTHPLTPAAMTAIITNKSDRGNAR